MFSTTTAVCPVSHSFPKDLRIASARWFANSNSNCFATRFWRWLLGVFAHFEVWSRCAWFTAAVWVWNITPPSNHTFHSVGIHSTRCKTNRKSCKTLHLKKKSQKGPSSLTRRYPSPLTFGSRLPLREFNTLLLAFRIRFGRSNWAQHPESGAAARQLNLRWCWDTWCSRNLWCWFSSDCGTHKDRSGGCSARWHRWHPYTEMCWDKDPLQPNLCLPQRLSASFGHYQRLGDSHWGRCLCRVRRASPWVSLWRTMGMEPFLRRASLTSIPPKSYHIHSKR